MGPPLFAGQREAARVLETLLGGPASPDLVSPLKKKSKVRSQDQESLQHPWIR